MEKRSISNRDLFKQYLAHTSDFPLAIEIERAEGVYLYGPDGKVYLDLISGIGVSNLGHRHPKVIEAIQDQLEKYLHVMVYGEFIESPQVKLAEALSNSIPGANLSKVFLVNSGSEAIEGAVKLAKRYSGRPEIIACHNAYHGSSQGALSLCGNESFKQAYRPLLPGISHIHYGSFSDLEKITSKTAAVVIETIQGEAGVKIACREYFQALTHQCHKSGTLLILDEIQVGFGRTGKFWAFEHFDVVPDILVSAKGMGGGMPIGAFIAREDIMESLKRDPILGHISTFGGHPVSAAASLACILHIREEKLYEEAEKKGQFLRKRLKHPSIKKIRQIGLMMAVEFDSFERLKKIIDLAISRGIISDWFLYNDCSMRIAPPLTIREAELEKAATIILAAIEEVDQDVKR